MIGFAAGIPSIPLNLALLKSCQIVGVFYGAMTARDPALNATIGDELIGLVAIGRSPTARLGPLPAGAGRRSAASAHRPQGGRQGRRHALSSGSNRRRSRWSRLLHQMTARSPGLVGAVVASLVQCRCVAMTPGCRSSRRSSSPSRALRPAGRRPPTTSRTSWPQRRFASCGAADPASGTLYAFGGRGDDGTTHHGDLWALDLGDRRQRPEWHRAAEAGAVDAPPPVRYLRRGLGARVAAAAGVRGWERQHPRRRFARVRSGRRSVDRPVLDRNVRSRSVAAGGRAARRRFGAWSVPLFGGTSGPYSDELWSYDLVTSSWQRIIAPGPISRGGHSMVLDPSGEVVWLFGGTRPGADLDDLWHLDLSTDTWTEVCTCAPACPSPRSAASLVADPVGDRLVLYGGWESTTNTYRHEAWVLDDLATTPAWSLVEPASELPQARFFHVAGYDPAGRRMVVFGGGANGHAYKDALGLTLPTDRRPAAWHMLSPTTALTARDQATLVVDDDVVTAFDGFGAGTLPGTLDAGTHLADTWQRQLNRRGRGTWRLHPTPPRCPSPARVPPTHSTPPATVCCSSAGSLGTRHSPTSGSQSCRGPVGHAGSSCARRCRAASVPRRAGAPMPFRREV